MTPIKRFGILLVSFIFRISLFFGLTALALVLVFSDPNNLKQALISILIGCSVAFISTLFQELANFLNQHSEQIISGAVSSAVYLAKAYRA